MKTRTGVSLQDLLLSRKAPTVHYDPFPWFCVDGFFPATVYDELLAGFPADEYFVREATGGKRAFSSTRTPDVFEQFQRAQPLWKDVLDVLASPAFLVDFHRVVRSGLFRARKLAGLKAWNSGTPASRGLRAKLVQPIHAQLEFSRMTRGTFILPHTDSGAKLVSAMFYFPARGWRPEFGGGTEFYRPADPALKNNWGNQECRFEQMRPFMTTEFVPNRMVVFLKTKDSYHGVPRIDCDASLTRDSLNFNVLMRK